LFVRYIIDDSCSLVHCFGSAPGTYVQGFPVEHTARNVQNRSNFGREMLNELRFGVNRTAVNFDGRYASEASYGQNPTAAMVVFPG
jgi:hypothetical protein